MALARQIGWQEFKNRELLREAEDTGYELFLHAGNNIRYQQYLSGRRIAIVVLGNQQWPDVKLQLDRIVAAVNAAISGSYAEVEIPNKD